MILARQSDPQLRQSERGCNPLMNELTEVLARAAFDYLRNYPKARARMVFEFAAHRPFQPPLGKSLEPLALIQPLALRIRRVRKSTNVEQNLLDGHRVLTVGAKLGDDLRDALARIQLALADQNPRRRRHDRLRAREDRVERVVGGRLFTSTLDCASDRAHRADFSIVGARDLSRWQQPILDFAFGTIEKGFDFFRIEAGFAWTVSKMTLRGHCGHPLRLNFSLRDITHRRRFVIRKRSAPDLATKSTRPCPAASSE